MSHITIVIPIYNRAHTIVRTLHSIDAQNAVNGIAGSMALSV